MNKFALNVTNFFSFINHFFQTTASSWSLWVIPLIVFKNTEIVYQSELRFLGILLTDTLKWYVHAQVLKAKLCKVNYMVKILKETMSPNMIRIVYFSDLNLA